MDAVVLLRSLRELKSDLELNTSRVDIMIDYIEAQESQEAQACP